jgi:hypothetical protein
VDAGGIAQGGLMRDHETEVTDAIPVVAVFVLLVFLGLIGFAVGAWWALAHWWPA